MEDIRWVQRLQNFQKTLKNLQTALNISSPDEVQRAGMIQYFEMTFELGWKVLKDYLETQGFSEVSSPRQAIKKAYEQGLLENGRGWLKGLEDRNLTSHTYDEITAKKVEALIKEEYIKLFEALARNMESKK